MADNPYAAYPAEHRHADDGGMDDRPRRVSILAVLSLIFSIVCCVPGFGVIGVILGVASAFGIQKSRGRVTGLPLAVVGILLGIIATLGWVVVGGGAMQMYKVYVNEIIPDTETALRDGYSGDIGAFRQGLNQDAGAELTDADILAFFAILRADRGEFVGAAADMETMMEAFAQSYGGNQNRSVSGGQNTAIPVAVEFANGFSVAHVVPDEDSLQMADLVIADMFVILDDGRALTLRKDGPASFAAMDFSFKPVHASEWSPAAAPTTPDPEPPPEEPEPAPASPQ